VIQVNALLECQRRLVEGADRNPIHSLNIDRGSGTLPLPTPAEQTHAAKPVANTRQRSVDDARVSRVQARWPVVSIGRAKAGLIDCSIRRGDLCSRFVAPLKAP
jgi:hypothetical protein